MCAKIETGIEKYGATIFFFINGVLFGFIWEKLGTNYAWSYANLGPTIFGVPIVIPMLWGVYSLFSGILVTKSARNFLYHSSPLILSLFLEPCAIKLGFWKYFFLNGEILSLVPYFVLGYLLITLSFNKINDFGWRYISKQKNQVTKATVMLICMVLFAIDGVFIYSVLSVIYFKKAPIWLYSRLFFE